MPDPELKHAIIADTSLGGALFGGAQTFLFGLVFGLIDLGWRVTILSELRPTASQEHELRRAGAETVFGLWSPRMLMEDIAPRLAAWINGQDPHVYVVSVSSGAGWVALPFLRPRISTVGIAHTDSKTFYEPLRHYGKLLSGAVGVSERIALRLTADCGIDASSVFHIPYGVRIGEAESAVEKQIKRSVQEPLRLIFVGRLEQPQKRISDLVALVKQLVRRGVDFVLDIVGDGPEASEVERALSAEKHRSMVVFHGWLSGNEVVSRLRQADIFILTSAYEGLPVALLEAMANGVVPLVTDIDSGHRQLVAHGVNGFLAPVSDVGRFAELICQLSADRQLLERMRLNARETGAKFSVEEMVRNYAGMFEILITAKTSDRDRRPADNYPLMASCRSRYPLWLRRLKVAAYSATREWEL